MIETNFTERKIEIQAYLENSLLPFWLDRLGKLDNGGFVTHFDQYGNDTVRIRTEGGTAVLNNVSGIEKLKDFGQIQELRLLKEADPQQILADILSRTTVQHFELVNPSLHDIFIRIAGPEAREVNHA